MTPKERYVKALQELLAAQKAVQEEQDNPFNLGMPTHLGLSDETFISEAELNHLDQKIGSAVESNTSFAKIWNLGTDLLLKAKALLL
jgi:hypothetical protein